MMFQFGRPNLASPCARVVIQSGPARANTRAQIHWARATRTTWWGSITGSLADYRVPYSYTRQAWPAELGQRGGAAHLLLARPGFG